MMQRQDAIKQNLLTLIPGTDFDSPAFRARVATEPDVFASVDSEGTVCFSLAFWSEYLWKTFKQSSKER
jgi:hypothetical protein